MCLAFSEWIVSNALNKAAIPHSMKLEDLPIDWSRIRLTTPGYESVIPEKRTSSDKSLETLLIQKTRVIKTKLEALASVAQERLAIRKRNLSRITDDQSELSEMIQKLTVSANYQLRDHKEKGGLYKKAFELQQERRTQDTECWRDIVLVLRDLLAFWDEYEHAKARGAFLADVG